MHSIYKFVLWTVLWLKCPVESRMSWAIWSLSL